MTSAKRLDQKESSGDTAPKKGDTAQNVGLEVRRLEVQDLGDVYALETIVYPGDAWSETQIEEELASHWTTYFGGFIGEDLVGYVGAKGGVEGDIMTVAVHPEDRKSVV